MAQELAFMMTGTSHAMFNVKNIDAYIKRNKSPILSVTVPVITQRYRGATPALARLIETSYILGSGQLYANSFALDHHDICLDEIGDYHAGLMSLPLKDEDETEIVRMDLRGKTAWQALVS